jgi:hypothetical protein
LCQSPSLAEFLERDFEEKLSRAFLDVDALGIEARPKRTHVSPAMEHRDDAHFVGRGRVVDAVGKASKHSPPQSSTCDRCHLWTVAEQRHQAAQFEQERLG